MSMLFKEMQKIQNIDIRKTSALKNADADADANVKKCGTSADADIRPIPNTYII